MQHDRTLELGENLTVNLPSGESVEIPAWVIHRLKLVTEVYEPPLSERNLMRRKDIFAELVLRFPIDQYTVDMNVDKPYQVEVETNYIRHRF